jgi:hypothetical protein
MHGQPVIKKNCYDVTMLKSNLEFVIQNYITQVSITFATRKRIVTHSPTTHRHAHYNLNTGHRVSFEIWAKTELQFRENYLN